MKNILIVEDNAEARRWLGEMVAETYPDARVNFADSVRAASKYQSVPCDLALIDLGLPDGSGIAVLRMVDAGNPGAIKVVTTVMADDASIVAALSAGADGYLLKETDVAVFRRQLTQLSMGVPAISPAVARRIMEHFRLTGPTAGVDATLTAREAQVLGLISRGLRNTEVATDMGIAESTVASYIKIIYRKLGIGSRAEAAWHASRLGLRGGNDSAD